MRFRAGGVRGRLDDIEGRRRRFRRRGKPFLGRDAGPQSRLDGGLLPRRHDFRFDAHSPGSVAAAASQRRHPTHRLHLQIARRQMRAPRPTSKSRAQEGPSLCCDCTCGLLTTH